MQKNQNQTFPLVLGLNSGSSDHRSAALTVRPLSTPQASSALNSIKSHILKSFNPQIPHSHHVGNKANDQFLQSLSTKQETQVYITPSANENLRVR